MKLPKLPVGKIYEDVKSFSFLNDITGLFNHNNNQNNGSPPNDNNNISLGGMSLTTIIVLVLLVSVLRK